MSSQQLQLRRFTRSGCRDGGGTVSAPGVCGWCCLGFLTTGCLARGARRKSKRLRLWTHRPCACRFRIPLCRQGPLARRVGAATPTCISASSNLLPAPSLWTEADTKQDRTTATGSRGLEGLFSRHAISAGTPFMADACRRRLPLNQLPPTSTSRFAALSESIVEARCDRSLVSITTSRTTALAGSSVKMR
jgi:hypothetical protein